MAFWHTSAIVFGYIHFFAALIYKICPITTGYRLFVPFSAVNFTYREKIPGYVQNLRDSGIYAANFSAYVK